MARNIDNLSTDNQAMRGERQLAPRGITPFDEIGDPNIHRNYLGRTKEYLELLRYRKHFAITDIIAYYCL